MTRKDTIVSFAQGMKKASEIISELDPSFIIAPMMGAVPFIDSMYVANENFDPNNVYYMPASSHIPQINRIMRDWLSNFLKENVTAENPRLIVNIDEVVSGGSAIRVNRAIEEEIRKRRKKLVGNVLTKFWTTDDSEFEEAAQYLDYLTDFDHHQFLTHIVSNKMMGIYREEKGALMSDCEDLKRLVQDHFKNHITHIAIGIEDSKSGVYDTRPRNVAYREMVSSGLVLPVSVRNIITMDKAEYCPVQYESLSRDESDYLRFNPRVDAVPMITREYIRLLSQISLIEDSRRDPFPVSIERAVYSEDYLSSEYGGQYQPE